MINAPQKHMEEFVTILKRSLEPNNVTRKESESRLNSIDKETKANLLLQVLVNEKDVSVLEIASLLLRQLIDQTRRPQILSDTTISNLKNTVPQLCLQQQNGHIRRKYVDIVSSLILHCRKDEKNKWTEINSFFYDCLVRSNHDVGKEIGLRLLEASPCILNDFSEDYLANVMKVLCEILSFDTRTHKNLVIGSLKACSSIFIELPLKRLRKLMDAPIQLAFHVIKNSQDFSVVNEFLDEIILIIECRSKIFREHILMVVESIVGLLASQHVSEEARMSAMECVVSLAEQSRKTFRTQARDQLPNLVEILIRHITLIEDDPEWGFSVKEDGEDGENDIPTTAETSLDRLTCALGGKVMFPIIMEKVSPLLSSTVWQHRCAALITIGCIAEGCVKILKPHLPRVVEAITVFIKDQHPKVVYYCINTLGQLAVDYCTHFHSNYHQQVFPVIFFAAENCSAYPRVQARAICCYVNLLDGCPRKIVDIYADKFFSSLRELFISSVNTLNKPGVPIVLENVLSSLSKFAETLERDFTKYYRNIISEILTLIRSLASTPHVKYFIHALETLCSILIAVGQRECFHELDSVLEILKSFEIRSVKPTDSENFQLDYLEIMADMADVFGDSFSSVLPTLVPVLLELVSAQNDTQLISASFDPSSDHNGLTKIISARTDAIRDKNTACLILQKLCKSAQLSMSNYVDQICDVTIKNFMECIDDDIQYACCSTFSLILRCAEPKGSNHMLQLWARIFQAVFTRVTGSDKAFCCDKAFDGLRDCILVVSYAGLSDDVLNKIIIMMVSQINECITDYGGSSPSNIFGDDNGESDEDSIDDDDNEEDLILSAIEQLSRMLFKTLQTNYFPYFSKAFDSIMKLSECSNVSLRSWAICLLGDLIEFCPKESVHFSGLFLERLKVLLNDECPIVRQSAFFVTGLIVEFGSQIYQTYISFSLPIMVKWISLQTSRDEENGAATANAIAAVGKVMKFSPHLISPFEPAVITWLSWLPVIEDEADFILTYLVELIEGKFQIFVNPDNSNLYKALDSLASMIPYVDEEVSKKAIYLLNQLKAHIPESFDFWYNNLCESLKSNVEYARTANVVT